MGTPPHRWSRRDFVQIGIAAAAGPVLTSCHSPTEPEDIRLTSRPGIPTIVPTVGPTPLNLGTGGSIRDGILYVPQTYQDTTPAPLLIALHGAGGAGADWSSYYPRAEANGMVLLTPDSRSNTWDLIASSVGPDVRFIDRALNHTFARCRIAPTRICLGGFSDGATYSLLLGLTNGDFFSHVIAYSPGFLTQAGAYVGDPEVFISHGNADPVLPVESSRDVIVPQLRNAGYRVTYREFSGGHQVPAAISDEAVTWFVS